MRICALVVCFICCYGCQKDPTQIGFDYAVKNHDEQQSLIAKQQKEASELEAKHALAVQQRQKIDSLLDALANSKSETERVEILRQLDFERNKAKNLMSK